MNRFWVPKRKLVQIVSKLEDKLEDSRQIEPRTAGPRTVGPRTAGPRTVGPRTAGSQTVGTRTAGSRTVGPRTAGSWTVGPWTFGGVIKLDCCLWALSGAERGRAQFQKCVYNSTLLILSWFLRQTFGGVYQAGLLCFGGEGTISKMCTEFNILDFIQIFVPNIWGNYHIGLLSLRQACQCNILDFILIFVPKVWGVISFWVPGK